MRTPRRDAPDLLADIGGTHVRFGLSSRPGEVEHARKLECARYATVIDAARAYLETVETAPPGRAAFAVASPIDGDRVRLTNHVWTFSIEEVRRQLGLEHLEVLNDFAALALSLPALGAGDLQEIKPGDPVPGAPRAVLGPGTGLGMAGIVALGDSWSVVSGEGGHADLPARSEREWQVVRRLAARFERASLERALSGPGLVNLYEALCRLGQREPQSLTPAAVVAGALEGGSTDCTEALGLFSGWLGAAAGNLALTIGARGGVYLGGGVLLRIGAGFDRERFVDGFVAKGRFRDYLRAIPVHLITRPQATLLGTLAALARRA